MLMPCAREVAELIHIATSKKTRPPEVDISVAAFVVASEEQVKVADHPSTTALKPSRMMFVRRTKSAFLSV